MAKQARQSLGRLVLALFLAVDSSEVNFATLLACACGQRLFAQERERVADLLVAGLDSGGGHRSRC